MHEIHLVVLVKPIGADEPMDTARKLMRKIEKQDLAESTRLLVAKVHVPKKEKQ